MLSPEIIKKIKKIHIKSRRDVNSMMAGQFKSIFRGTGMEFEEVREYSPGDDVKSIDWNVSARLGKPYIKLYREEREVVVMLLVDMSRSLHFGTTSAMKIEKSAEIAAVLAFNAIKNNDKVGVILFTDRVEKYIPPKKGSAHIWRVIKEIFTFKPEYAATDINAAVNYLGKVLRKKTVSFIISDFLSSDYKRQIRSVSKKHELISVFVSDPGDFKLPNSGVITIRDLESGNLLQLDGSDKKTQKAFSGLKRTAYQKTLETMKQAMIDCIEISSGDSVADALTKYFRYREKRIR